MILLFTTLWSLIGLAMSPEPSLLFALHGRLTTPVMSEQGGTAYLQITLTAPAVVHRQHRTPVNLAVVIDRSGSMGDQRKMEYVKQAFLQLTDRLHPDDILSLIVYDDVIEVLRPAHRIGSDASRIRRLLSEIAPRGSTNLGGGLLQGLQEAARYSREGYVNRVVLLSDGLANVGITDPVRLNAMAREYRRRSVSVTTMGVGLDYNEDLMMGLSESGGGNYYFIEHPNGLAAIVRKELQSAGTVLAQNTMIRLRLGAGVLAADVLGCEFRNDREELLIPVGDLYAGETREFTIELTIPTGKGHRSVASGELLYDGAPGSVQRPLFSAEVRYSPDLAECEKHRDIDAQAKADIARSARSVEQAMQAAEKGNMTEATEKLNEAKDVVANSAAAGAASPAGEAVRSQLGRITTYQQTTKEETDVRKMKKSIQYENYKTRRNK